jgi:ATP-binding cassette subfamily F protein uup
VIEAYEKHWKIQEKKLTKKAFDGMDQHNAWDFETQYKQILFKLKLEDFKQSKKTFQVDKKAFVSCYHFDQSS